MQPLPSLTVPVFTPMTAAGEVDVGKVPAYAELVGGSGIRSVLVCGSTGEFASLTVSERQQLLLAWLKAKEAGLVDTVVAHVGSCCLAEAVELSRHAAQSGADAVAALPAWYYGVSCADSVAEQLAKVAAECRQLPFVVYLFPGLSSIRCDSVELLQLAAAKIPNLVAVKFTDSSLEQMAAAAEIVVGRGSRLQVLLGLDRLWLPALSLGVAGCVGIGQNFLPAEFAAVAERLEAGDLPAARQQMRRIDKFISTVSGALAKYDLFSLMKAAMCLLRLDVGPPRLPLKSLRPADIAVLRHRLQHEGFLTADQLS